MMFGIPGAALAMVKCAKPGKKKVAIGLVASAALCAFICGVTEPFEFGFMFLAPVLYVIYAALYGIFTMITVALGFRAGFSFSAGAMDLFFSASLPAAAKPCNSKGDRIILFASYWKIIKGLYCWHEFISCLFL